MNPLTQFKKIAIPALVIVAVVSPRFACADAVTDWNLIASNAIVVTAGQPPQVSSLSFAMVQGAVYDAVNAIDRGKTRSGHGSATKGFSVSHRATAEENGIAHDAAQRAGRSNSKGQRSDSDKHTYAQNGFE